MDIKETANNYILTGDYHTHSVYSRVGPHRHGKGSIMDNVRAAHEKGLRELAITDHGPDNFFGLDIARIADMRADIKEAMEAYPDVKVYLGVEADIVDSENGLDVAERDFLLFDFVNAGYHYVHNCHMYANLFAYRAPIFSGQIERLRKQNTERIIKALTNNKIKILTHPGDKAYVDEEEIAACCAMTGTLVEINSRHSHPDADDLRIYAAHDVSFIISSDAHRPESVGVYLNSLEMALSAGIDPARIVNIEERK